MCVRAVTATILAASGCSLSVPIVKRVETCRSVDRIVWRFLSRIGFGFLISARKLASALVR